MAGTPTTNYNIPTYADTDAPDLSGAYNDAMGIIDTQLKANADAIESASTGNYTGTAPITVNNEDRTISVANAAVSSDGAGSTPGTVTVTGKASAINTGVALDSKVVPNARAVADYVAAHGGTTYTAGEGIIISDRVISVGASGYVDATDGTPTATSIGGVYRCTEANAVDVIANDASSSSSPTMMQSRQTVPTVLCLKDYVTSRTPDASTSAKGLVQLTTSPASADSTMAVTGSGVVRLLGDRKTNATTNVTVDMLKNLYVDTSTGVVYYKAPSE